MSENTDFLTSQIITYLGNKRILIGYIEKEISAIKEKLGKKKLVCADLFSGSGIVARMLKQHSSTVIVNDLENYSSILNSCYLTNKSDFDSEKYFEERTKIEKEFFEGPKIPGIICENYAPKETSNIQSGERVFYSRENAERIDTYRALIEKIEDESLRKYFLAPLLTECSVHVNTSGIFKGFYKDKHTGIGCFGGTGKNALSRILGQIELPVPVFSNYKSKAEIFQEDTVTLSSKLKKIDIAYLDPPYNQHPYGSNYFMLNIIANNEIPPVKLSKVSGIPANWNRSSFNKKAEVLGSMEEIVKNLDAKFIIISYNSEGFIKFDDMKSMLKKYGKVKTVEITYNTFRGSRNLRARDIHVSEYLFVVEK